ncbi:AAA family ATPase [Candidatus Bathyarchaeota archaeon]|nr:AAA family ATPase [Candidatus Bathyarchaeota archaeon]
MGELTADMIRKKSSISKPCKTTEELAPLQETFGQERAVRALRFGLGIGNQGFNIYVAGMPGTGRSSTVRRFLGELAAAMPAPSDWCYVNNFKDAYTPRALELPAGKGNEFAADMKRFIDGVSRAIPQAFESEDYSNRREATLKSVQEESKRVLLNLEQKVQKQGFVIQSTRIGLFIIPVVDGKPLNEQQLMSLPPNERNEIEENREKLGEEVRNTLLQVRRLENKIEEAVRKLNHDVTLYAIDGLITELLEKYSRAAEIKEYLEEVRGDIVANAEQFLTPPKELLQQQQQIPFQWRREASLRKYDVNVIVDNSSTKGAPVVTETNPAYANVLGRIEREALFGALTTDFTMIRAGALHKANGGYLVLNALELLRDMMAYEVLKKSLQSSSIKIEDVGERLGFLSTKSLRPEPIPLKTKVVLIGDPILYQRLFELDPEFKELFKVKADFDTSIDRNDENLESYASFLCMISQKEKLKYLDTSGVDKIVEHSARMADHQDKLSTRFAEVADIVREANYYASEEGSQNITGEHVKKAIEERIYRSNLIQEKIQEAIQKGFILIDTKGEAVGQVNGLTIMGLGDISFGSPSRVTATIGLGRGRVIDIEREAKLGGPIHTKGVMILGGYLADKFSQERPLSLSARLVFEQSYGMVEGDSASSTELYSILSCLAGLPVKQNYAVTGSVNQKGEVQAIGGINQKIEGYYEVCKAKGLTGEQGILMPESNVQNLMLKEEVVEAVRAGKFHIHSVKTIDEGISILTGKKAGTRTADRSFEEGTVNYLVDKRLHEMAERMTQFSKPATEEPRKQAIAESENKMA